MKINKFNHGNANQAMARYNDELKLSTILMGTKNKTCLRD